MTASYLFYWAVSSRTTVSYQTESYIGRPTILYRQQYLYRIQNGQYKSAHTGANNAIATV